MKQGIFSGGLLRATMALAVLAPTFGSCLRDNLDDCPPDYNVLLRVVTDYEKAEDLRTRGTYHHMDDDEFDRHREGWYEDEITSVTVYVFDEEYYFVDSWRGPAYTLGEEYVVPFLLEGEGRRYHFVAWTNSGRESHYIPSLYEEELTAGASHDDLHINIDLPEDRTLIEDIAHRHHGVLESRPVFSGINEYEIVISPHTYRVNFIARGLPSGGNQYDVKVTDCNVRHSLSGAPVGEHEDYYHTRTLANGSDTRAAGDLTASMVLLQIGDDTGTSFELANTTLERSLYNNDLLQTIQTAYSEQIGPNKTFADLDDMLENKYEYDIVLTHTPLGVTVEVHPWDYKGNATNL